MSGGSAKPEIAAKCCWRLHRRASAFWATCRSITAGNSRKQLRNWRKQCESPYVRCCARARHLLHSLVCTSREERRSLLARRTAEGTGGRLSSSKLFGKLFGGWGSLLGHGNQGLERPHRDSQ